MRKMEKDKREEGGEGEWRRKTREEEERVRESGKKWENRKGGEEWDKYER